MQRPEGITPAVWETWTAVQTAADPSRQTEDVPTSDQEALASITRMGQDLAAELARTSAAPAPTPAPTGDNELPFTVEDVPEYHGDYIDYRRKLREFVHIYQDMPAYLVPRAMLAIKAGLKEKGMSKLVSFKGSYEFAQNGRTFLQAWQAWQNWMDDQLTSVTQYEAEIASWETMKKNARFAHSSQEFYILFEAGLYRFNEACLLMNVPQPSESEITRHFMQALPRPIALQLRQVAPHYDLEHYRRHKDTLDAIWPEFRGIKARALEAGAKREWSEDPEEATSYAAPAAKRRSPNTARCTLRKALDNSPRVPQKYRGNIAYVPENSLKENRIAYKRRQEVRAANRCAAFRCRRTRDEHSADFIEVKPWDGPNVRVMEITVDDEPLDDSEKAPHEE
ncbi:hypothetical protein B0I35DRAFT_484772 [Stachybotrys elegans]|uniref:Uncharacterized protein n=1 Tax=Stachybotrys elegans TaxID=80388 RepID=A0A8K0SHN5_9HYPO|nr:hypothetical protein B0I35DRAFT_484772 [Stachybotrys elegans]